MKKGAFIIKLCIAAAIVASAIFLKTISSDYAKEISRIINGNFDYKEAVSAIGRAISGDEDEVVEVFEDENEFVVPEEFYEEDSAAVEALSFQMSAEELQDDTKAEVFKIPPPSYCSYDKVDIKFSYTTPLYGTITSKYGYRDHPIIDDASFHTGLDIAAASGSAIACFADGVVLEAKHNKTYGNYILIEHADNIRSFYGHNSKLYVKRGARVKKGQKIAAVGTTGLSTGPHLHFEIRRGTLRLDPMYYIKVKNT